MPPVTENRNPTVLDRLVADMRDLYAAQGAATEEDLARLGWRPDEVKRHLSAARTRLGPITSRAA
ncbi:hypothetical protein [Xanthobacter sp.]|uniref:hypothetical protein n=1 Tax=Xanthobacter sp. TaxID=35809 RepID=UPI0025FE6886|nr:hypothetical protein [Xanthobacter sp.]